MHDPAVTTGGATATTRDTAWRWTLYATVLTSAVAVGANLLATAALEAGPLAHPDAPLLLVQLNQALLALADAVRTATWVVFAVTLAMGSGVALRVGVRTVAR